MIEIFGFERVARRFWPKVRVDFGCWEWTASKHADGYGMLMCRNAKAGYPRKLLRAHQISWELHFGPIPKGQHVLHSCDNPACVNPGHLFLGSHHDNMRDKAVKGRARHGDIAKDKHPMAVLNEGLVGRLRERKASGERVADMARELGVKYGTVWAAVAGKNW